MPKIWYKRFWQEKEDKPFNNWFESWYGFHTDYDSGINEQEE